MLITLGIIGVVAALILPAILTNVNERVYSHRQANIAYKVTQAMDKMHSLGLLHGNYKSTDDFVDELQKHLKIQKRCNASHISDCWPSAKVTMSDGEEYEVKNAKTGKNLSLKNNKTDNVGLVLRDGAAIILTYNQDSSGTDVSTGITAEKKSLPVGFGKSEEFAYTSSSTTSIDFVMDVNGKRGPNSETRDNRMFDIRSFKVARFSPYLCTGVEIAGIGCVVYLGGNYDCITGADKAKWDKDGSFDPSCWGGAKKACDDIGMSLPDVETLKKINSKRREYPEIIQSAWLWSSDVEGSFALTFSFGVPNDSYYLTTGEYKSYRRGAMCVGD